MPLINKITNYRKLAAFAYSGDEAAAKILLDDRVITPTSDKVTTTEAKLKGFLEGIDFVLDCVRQAKQDSKLKALDIDISTNW